MIFNIDFPPWATVVKKRKKPGPVIYAAVFFILALLLTGYLGYRQGWLFGGSSLGIFAARSHEGEPAADKTKSPDAGGGNPESGTGNPGAGEEDVTPQGGAKGDNGQEGSLPQDMSPLKERIEDYLKDFQGQYGVYYINLAEGSEFGIRDTEEYVAASTVKVPINLYLFQKIKAGEIDPESVMEYTKADREGGTGTIQYQELGSEYTVRELSRLSIEVSDNVAVNMLIRLLGRENFKNFMKELGGQVVYYDNNLSCPRDMALYMKKVYEFGLSDPELGGELIAYLCNTIFNDRIPKLLPQGVKVAHKIGSYFSDTSGHVVNDVGIVYAEKPYVIAIMSQGVSLEEAPDVIANISRMVYDYVTGSN